MGPLTEQIALRITGDERAKIRALRDKLPLATEAQIARELLRIGLAAAEKDPSIFLIKPPQTPP